MNSAASFVGVVIGLAAFPSEQHQCSVCSLYGDIARIFTISSDPLPRVPLSSLPSSHSLGAPSASSIIPCQGSGKRTE